MKIQQAKELSLEYKKIWQTKQIIMLLIIAVILIFEILFMVIISPSNIKDGIIVGVILLATIILGLSVLFIEEKKRKEYNDLINTGVVLIGKVNQIVIHSPQKGADIEATYFDSTLGKVYCFREKDWSVANHFSAFYTVFNEQKYIKEHPLIYILVRKDNYKKGYILMREYFEGKPSVGDLFGE